MDREHSDLQRLKKQLNIVQQSASSHACKKRLMGLSAQTDGEGSESSLEVERLGRCYAALKGSCSFFA